MTTPTLADRITRTARVADDLLGGLATLYEHCGWTPDAINPGRGRCNLLDALRCTAGGGVTCTDDGQPVFTDPTETIPLMALRAAAVRLLSTAAPSSDPNPYAALDRLHQWETTAGRTEHQVLDAIARARDCRRPAAVA